MMVKLAVMMAAYNAAPYVGDALASLLRQRDAARLDIIVVNDGSTDGTGEIVRALALHAPEIRLIDTRNGGVTRARNVALAALADDTDLVTFLDADDLSPAGRLARDLERFRRDPRLQVLYGTTRLFRQTGEDRFAPDPGGPSMDVRGVQLAAGLYACRLIREVGWFDTSFQQAEDMDFMLRMFELAPRHEVTEEICLYYRRHATNITREAETLRRDFSRALLKSMQRRRQHGGAPPPPGLFDAKSFAEGIDW